MKITHTLIALLSAAAIPAFGQKLTDPQIAAIVVTANQVDIDAGNYAASTSSDSEVQQFANTMVTDHTAVNKAAVDLVTKLGVTPEENDTSRSLKSGGDQNLATLRTLKGAAFDKAYVDHEVAYHEQVIKALDDALIPDASNAELKALLIKVRPAFVAHLGHRQAPAGPIQQVADPVSRRDRGPDRLGAGPCRRVRLLAGPGRGRPPACRHDREHGVLPPGPEDYSRGPGRVHQSRPGHPHRDRQGGRGLRDLDWSPDQ